MDPTTRFADLVRGEDASIPLDEAALVVAQHAFPMLDVAHERQRLDELAARAAAKVVDAEDLLRYLYAAEGFRGNREGYADPANSYLNVVLDRRLGIPISLGIVLIEVGRRLGLTLVGVNMPGHFLVSAAGTMIDPFDGIAIDRAGCEQRFRATQPEGASFHPSVLEPATPRAILARLLANLRALFVASQDTRSLTWVLRLRTAIPGVPPEERLQLAGALAAQRRYDQAADVLDEMAADDGGDALRARARELRARLN